MTRLYGWPEPYMYIIYDRIFDDFPAKNTVYTPYIYGSGQPYTFGKTTLNVFGHTRHMDVVLAHSFVHATLKIKPTLACLRLNIVAL